MRRRHRRLSLLLPLLALAWSAHAGVALHVDGVEDPLKAAVIDRLELSQYAKREVTAAQATRLYQRVPEQVGAREGQMPLSWVELPKSPLPRL